MKGGEMMKLDKLRKVLEPYSTNAIAKELGVTRQGLYNKLEGKTRIRLDEAAILKRLTRMTDEEACDIFFDLD